MSKIGEMPITLPADVKFEIKGDVCTISGKEGELKITVPSSLKVTVKGQTISLERLSEDRKIRSLHGLYRSLLANAITGVQKPWEKRLEVVGTGYNVQQQGENLVLKVGYSHSVIFPQTAGIKLKIEDNNKIIISGIDKQMVGQIAQRIKSIKKSDVYKGKGIKYEGEKLRIKPGKKTGTTEGGAA